MKQYHIYMMSNKSNGTLYVGVTNDLQRRVYEHKNKLIKGSFTDKYDLNKLVYYEVYEDINVAIEREKHFKKAYRKEKIKLISAFNPDWEDLYEKII